MQRTLIRKSVHTTVHFISKHRRPSSLWQLRKHLSVTHSSEQSRHWNDPVWEGENQWQTSSDYVLQVGHILLGSHEHVHAHEPDTDLLVSVSALAKQLCKVEYLSILDIKASPVFTS